jgi:hypothetical protein
MDGDPGTLAAMMQRSKLRPKLRGSISVPCRAVKIRPVSITPSRASPGPEGNGTGFRR